jgi:hypothetical protein
VVMPSIDQMDETEALSPGRPASLTVIRTRHGELRCRSAEIPIGCFREMRVTGVGRKGEFVFAEIGRSARQSVLS